MGKKIIAHIGTHGTGKTTAVFEHAAQIKKTANVNLGVIFETVRSCPFPINRDASYESQLWIFNEQIKREIEACSKYDLVLTDRSVYDVMAYTVCAGLIDLADWMMSFKPNYYMEIVLHKITNEKYLAFDGVRDTDKEFQKNIQNILESILSYCNVKYTVYKE